MPIKSNKITGFTLIELLVIISIIGFLAAASVIAFNNARVKARNLTRNQNISQLIKAFQQAADNAGGVLASSGGAWACVSASCYGVYAVFAALSAIDAAIAPYIKKPIDPIESGRGIGGYLYINTGVGWSGKGPGAYLNWILEPVAVTADVCGPGFVHSITENYIQCLVKLD